MILISMNHNDIAFSGETRVGQNLYKDYLNIFEKC